MASSPYRSPGSESVSAGGDGWSVMQEDVEDVEDVAKRAAAVVETLDAPTLRARIMELELSLKDTEALREERLLQAATTRSVCGLLTNKLRELSDEMDERQGHGRSTTTELQQRSLKLEAELAALRFDTDELTARLSSMGSPVKVTAASFAAELEESQAHLENGHLDQRLLRDHVEFLESVTASITSEQDASVASMKEQHLKIKQALVQEVLWLRRETVAGEERIAWLKNAFEVMYGQCEIEGIPVLPGGAPSPRGSKCAPGAQ